MKNASPLLSAALALGVAACALKPAPAAGPFIVLQPPQGLGLAGVASAPALDIRRDTAALERQARRYVARPDSTPEVINQLSTLLLQTRSAVARMERTHVRGAYRVSDIIAARVAADALAAYLQTRTSPSAASTPVPVATSAPVKLPAPPPREEPAQ